MAAITTELRHCNHMYTMVTTIFTVHLEEAMFRLTGPWRWRIRLVAEVVRCHGIAAETTPGCGTMTTQSSMNTCA